MNRADAYNVLAARLNELRAMGYDALLPRVGHPAVREIVQINGEPVAIELEVSWSDRKRGTIRVNGTAFGPSTWALERLEESFVIEPAAARAR